MHIMMSALPGTYWQSSVLPRWSPSTTKDATDACRRAPTRFLKDISRVGCHRACCRHYRVGLTGRADLAGWIWLAVTIPVLLALIVEIVRSLLRGEVGLDIVAALSMSAALIFGEYLAAVVVAMMYSGGTFLWG